MIVDVLDGPVAVPISSSSPARSSNTSGVRAVNSIRAMSASEEVDEWLVLQMAALVRCSAKPVTSGTTRQTSSMTLRRSYSAARYNNEVNRLLGVLDRRLMAAISSPVKYLFRRHGASYPWVKIAGVFNQDMSNFPRAGVARTHRGAACCTKGCCGWRRAAAPAACAWK